MDGGYRAGRLLGEAFTGCIVTGRWSGYQWYDAGLRQVCWAHLTRDFEAVREAAWARN
ncbi:Transposase (IS66) [Stigmatella aurantiaca DW4/3-1]|uniref:Transposase (IS66) n=1 Tax=Stigmatella aurantiaca (strain DW4/3-1) TaxID=378806 RepID=E3FNB5_STIAD|nr:Transposase (IS66) [Stigmatella aurantiaca DW4/3-1]